MRHLGAGAVPTDVLRRFVLRFRGTLRHLYLWSAALDTGQDWRRVLAEWAVELRQLRSFNLRGLSATRRPEKGVVVFDGIARWEGGDGVPDEGTVEFEARPADTKKQGVTGVRFACASGREAEGDAQRLLGKLAEVARVESRRQFPRYHELAQWAMVGRRFVIGGKLEARLSPGFRSPDLETL